MHVYHVQSHLNGMDNFTMGKKVWNTTLKQEDPTPGNIVAVHSAFVTDYPLMI